MVRSHRSAAARAVRTEPAWKRSVSLHPERSRVSCHPPCIFPCQYHIHILSSPDPLPRSPTRTFQSPFLSSIERLFVPSLLNSRTKPRSWSLSSRLASNPRTKRSRSSVGVVSAVGLGVAVRAAERRLLCFSNTQTRSSVVSSSSTSPSECQP